MVAGVTIAGANQNTRAGDGERYFVVSGMQGDLKLVDKGGGEEEDVLPVSLEALLSAVVHHQPHTSTSAGCDEGVLAPGLSARRVTDGREVAGRIRHEEGSLIVLGYGLVAQRGAVEEELDLGCVGVHPHLHTGPVIVCHTLPRERPGLLQSTRGRQCELLVVLAVTVVEPNRWPNAAVDVHTPVLSVNDSAIVEPEYLVGIGGVALLSPPWVRVPEELDALARVGFAPQHDVPIAHRHNLPALQGGVGDAGPGHEVAVVEYGEVAVLPGVRGNMHHGHVEVELCLVVVPGVLEIPSKVNNAKMRVGCRPLCGCLLPSVVEPSPVKAPLHKLSVSNGLPAVLEAGPGVEGANKRHGVVDLVAAVARARARLGRDQGGAREGCVEGVVSLVVVVDAEHVRDLLAPLVP
mmetsp:Transcript_11344/g.25808  ORF Transcript_11344/g.25808 Transcript_11344/m.25808 type:complete len:407 (+) Transcript_11344:378-1598(+)